MTPAEISQLYFSSDDEVERCKIRGEIMDRPANSELAAVAWDHPPTLEALNQKSSWKRALRGGFLKHPSPYGIVIPPSLLPAEVEQRTLFHFLTGEWRDVYRCDPAGKCAALWRTTLSHTLYQRVGTSLMRMLDDISEAHDGIAEPALATLCVHLGHRPSKELLEVHRRHPKVFEQLRREHSSLRTVKEASSLAEGRTPFVESLIAALRDYRAGDHILALLADRVPRWSTELWSQLDTVLREPESGLLFPLLLRYIPRRIFETFEAGHLLDLMEPDDRSLALLVEETAQSGSPQRRKALIDAPFGWKLAMADQFDDEAELSVETGSLLKEILADSPADLINGYTAKKIEGRAGRDFALYCNWDVPSVRGVPTPFWLAQEPSPWPRELDRSSFRTAGRSLQWLEYLSRYGSGAHKRAQRKLDFLSPLLREERPPYALDRPRQTRLLAGLDLFWELYYHQDDPTINILYPLLDLLGQDDSETSYLLRRLFVKRPVKRIFQPRVSPRNIPIPREDGLFQCFECKEWFKESQLSRAAQCHTCYMGGDW